MKLGVKNVQGWGKKDGGQKACACVSAAGTKEGDKGWEEERVYVSTHDGWEKGRGICGEYSKTLYRELGMLQEKGVSGLTRGTRGEFEERPVVFWCQSWLKPRYGCTVSDVLSGPYF